MFFSVRPDFFDIAFYYLQMPIPEVSEHAFCYLQMPMPQVSDSSLGCA